tara:strand:+ start:3759 stop:4067 length:309 start_codon:yes stop_codon:yes gene_type:complete
MKIKEYYKHYLSLHQNKTCRRLHVLGQTMTLIYLACVVHLVLSVSAFFIPLLLLVPFIVYPFAWSGHFFFEKNKPAAFKDPIKAKICDWIMLFDIIRGKIKF